MKKTVGQIATELWNNSEKPVPVKDLTGALLSKFDKSIVSCVNNGLRNYNGDFFVVVLTKMEKLFNNILRNYFIARQTCPPPNYDQIVYSYDRDKGELQLLWVIPDRHTSFWYKANALTVTSDEHYLLQCVLNFNDGTLDRECKKINNKIANKLRSQS